MTPCSPILSPAELHNCRALVCGMPEPGTYAIAEDLRRLLEAELGACVLVSLSDLSEAAHAALNNADMPVVLLSDSPTAAIVELARQATFPVALVVGDYANACRHVIRNGSPLADAVRAVAYARVGCWSIGAMPETILLDRTPDAAARLARALSLPDQGVLASVSSGSDSTVACADETTNQAIARLASFYGPIRFAAAASLDVPIPVFNDGVAPYGPSAGRYDLLGPARNLAFGPFLYLPAGDWRVTFAFRSERNRTGNSFRFDVIADGEVAAKQLIEITQSGRFRLHLSFTVTDSRQPVEFRSFLEKGAIEGEFELETVTVSA